MATTDFGSVTAAQKKVWAMEIWSAFRDESFFMSNGFVGDSMKDMNKPIYMIDELTKTERGLECIMQLVYDLTGDGVVGDNSLDDNEEAMQNGAVALHIDQLRNGVKSKGEMAEQATIIRFKDEARDKLSYWFASKIDELCFLTAAGIAYTLNLNGSTRGSSQLPSLAFAADVVAPSTNRIKYAGSATSTATLTTSDKINWQYIVGLNQYATTHGVKPIRDRAKDYYVVVLSPEQMRDLKLDSTYMTNLATARERGSKNPLFTGATEVVDGTVLYSHRRVPNTKGLGSGSKWGAAGTVEGATGILMGSQALGYGQVEEPFWRSTTKTDYGNRSGVGYGQKFGLMKPQFKSPSDGMTTEDFGTVVCRTAAAL